MPGKGEVIDSNYTSSIENLNINDWTKIQMTKTLEFLNGKTEGQPSFYSIEGEKVKYNMKLVIEYLTHLCKKEDGTLKTREKMMNDMQTENKKAGLSHGVSTPWIMAVQIALEYLGYDVGKIDGNKGGSRGRTGEAIKKYQEDNNLPIDGDPGPKVIESIINALNDKLISTIELDEFTQNFIIQGEKLYGKGLFTINADGTLKATKKLNSLIMYNQSNVGIIRNILDNVLKPGESIAIETRSVEDNSKRIIMNDMSGKIKYDESIEEYIINSSIKIIPDIGIDKYFAINDSNLISMQYLGKYGISMKSSKPLLDIILQEKSIRGYEDPTLGKKFDFSGDSPHKAIKYVFGNINESCYKELLPIRLENLLKLYKLKTLRGKQNFEKYMPTMLEIGLLTKENLREIVYIIDSNITNNEISKYLDLCKYLKNKNYQRIPNLSGYTVEHYFEMIKYLYEHNIPLDDLECCDVLLNNNMPIEAYCFTKNVRSMFCSDSSQLLEELFSNEIGKDLFLFLSKYPQRLENLGGKEIKEIELTTKPGGYNFCFRGILEMIKSRPDIKVPNKKNGETEWKQGRERIIKEYENLLRDYISLDKDEKGNDIPRNQTFDKIFYANAIKDTLEDPNGSLQEFDIRHVLKGFTQHFEDCSNTTNENGQLDKSHQENMIENIKKYVRIHPNEKILVYLGYHGFENGFSSNGWDKNDRLELAIISQNIKIMTTRCYLGGAYNNYNISDKNYIYGLQSPVLGVSNNTPAFSYADSLMIKGYDEKLLGFHEMQVYTRLHYNISFSPLTEYMDYRDFRSGKRKHGLVGLADLGGQERNDTAKC